ncbi:MAG: hypothetical protein ACOCV4_08570 [Myxococcota bacterium]
MARWSLPWMLGVLVGSACTPEYPGETAGTFTVTGRLDENTCGSDAVPAADPLVFDVELRREDGQAWWRRPDAPLVDGTVDADGVYRFRFQQVITVLEPDAGQPGCALEQSDQVEVSLTEIARDAGTTDAETTATDAETTTTDAETTTTDAGAPPSTLEGQQHVEMAPTAGSDCQSILATAGGPFHALPCTIVYTLEGSPAPEF